MGHLPQGGRRRASMAAGLALALGLAACEAPLGGTAAFEDEAPPAEPAEAVSSDVVAEVEPDTPEADDAPPGPALSDPDAADSVQPESETLFY